MAINMNAPGPWNNFSPSTVPVELQQATYDNYSYNGPVNASQPQINPAGVSSADGMMTLPAMQLYPGEELGIDGVPYRPSAGQNNNPESYSYEPNQGGSAEASATPVANVLGTRQFNQRTPSGSVYAPDMSAYNDSSLFNYTGQGGVPEYTYGQGLRTNGADYSIFGSPADIANPYFSGQFAKSTGPADAAINMNPVVMPAGVPAIGGGSGSTLTQAPSGVTPRPGGIGLTAQQAAQAMSQAGQDLTYQQTIDEMGIFGPNNPAPSTPFPSPGGATTLANLGLTERQIAQMSPQQQAYMTQALANQNRMQQGQLGFGTAPAMDDTLDVEAGMQRAGNYGLTMPDMGNNYGVGERFGSDSIFTGRGQDFYDTVNSGEFEAQQNFNRPTVPGLESVYDNNFDLGRPGDPSYQEFVSNPLDEAVTNYNAENLTTQQKMDMLQARADQVYGNMTAEEKRDGLFIEPTYSVSKDTMKLGIPDIFSTNNENVSSTGNLINRESPERNIFKSDEIDIPTPPFRPEGVEGVDYYQSTTGDYFAMEDDLGTQALKPVDPFAGMPPERNFFKPDEAGIDKPANLSSYEADGDIESTSGNMSALSDSFAAIDAKYAGSTTEASKNAELQDIIGVIINEFEGMKIEELALTPDAPYAEPSYRFADEGQDTGEFTSSFMGGGTPFDNPYVAPPLEDVVNPSNVAEIMFGIDTAMPQNGVRSQDNTMTMPTFREDVLPAPVYTPVPQPVVQPRPVYNTPTNAGPPGRNYSAPKVSTPRRSNYRFVGGR